MEYEVVATGERLHLVDTDAARALVATGQIKPVVKKQWVASKKPAKFIITEEFNTGQYFVAWTCSHCKQGGRFVGVRPDAIGQVRAWHCGHGGGEAIPEELQAQYRALPQNKVAAPFVIAGSKSCPENEALAEDLATRKQRAEAGAL